MEEIQQAYSNMIDLMPPVMAPLVRIAIVLVLSALIIRVGCMLVDRLMVRTYSEGSNFSESKRKTLVSLLKSIIKYVTYFVAFVNVLDIFGVDTASILTAAGVGGLAIGFGAQSLVKDIITGFFIIFEDQYNVGDYIEITGASGIVTEIGLRTTRIRDFGGQLHIVPNGEITRVTNHSRGDMRALVEVSIAQDEDVDKVISILEEVCEEVKAKRNDIISGPEVLGVTNLGPWEIGITIVARTIPMQQWSLEREIRKAVKHRFEQEGIRVPYQKMVCIKDKLQSEGVEH